MEMMWLFPFQMLV